MFGFMRQLRAEAPAANDVANPCVEENDVPAEPKKALDRRKISGARVTCTCEFILPNPDPFMHAKMLISGVIVLNVRGCCVYPEQKMSIEEIKAKVPVDKSLNITNFSVTGEDGQKFIMGELSIRRVRLLCDEHGQGVILRFSNMSEKQIDKLNHISAIYSEDD